jgi:hypothetical protein
MQALMLTMLIICIAMVVIMDFQQHGGVLTIMTIVAGTLCIVVWFIMAIFGAVPSDIQIINLSIGK